MSVFKSNKFYSITATSIERYLLLKGWVRDRDFKNKNLMVFNFANPRKRIAVPASEEFDDFFVVVQEVLQTIASVEKRSIEIIIKEILTVFYDRMEFRIVSSLSEDGKLPLDYAASCIEGLKELVLYSACAENSAQPVCFKAGNIAKDYLKSFKLAQTEVGSFIINIDIQVLDEEQEQTTIAECSLPPPFEHRVVERIYTAISQVDDAVECKHKLSDMVVSAYETGMTANMCEALMKMKPLVGDVEIDASICYASALNRTMGKKDHIVISDHHFYVIDELAKRYRDKVVFQDIVINGTIRSLSKHNVDDNYEKTIRLVTRIDGKYRVISIDLSDEDYRVACDAHRDELEVEVAGELDMSKQMWSMTKVEYFKIADYFQA